MDCPVCGEVHPECNEAMLDGMARATWQEAKQRLSAEGLEVLQMIDHAVGVLGVVDAWDAAENAENLSVDEVRIIETFLARKTLIDTARKELYEHED